MNTAPFRVTVVVVTAFFLNICIAAAFADGPTEVLVLLNANRTQIMPGRVYDLRNGKVSLLVDLLGERPLNESLGWVEREQLSSNPYKIARTYSDWCVNNVLVRHEENIWLVPGTVKSESLSTPHECLEIVNRPLSNLAYNRDAEIRINQWRSSLLNIIAKSEAQHQGEILLCTGVVFVDGGHVAAKETVGQIATEKFFAKIFKESPTLEVRDADIFSQNGHVYRKVNAVTVSASFLKIERDTSSYEPKVALMFGEKKDFKIEPNK